MQICVVLTQQLIAVKSTNRQARYNYQLGVVLVVHNCGQSYICTQIQVLNMSSTTWPNKRSMAISIDLAEPMWMY